MASYDDAEVENVYQSLLNKASRGTRTQSMSAPALSTEFVKSRFKRRAQPNTEGALAEIIIPSQSEIDAKVRIKHPNSNLFGYRATAAADVFPAGYGERSAMALAKEDQTFQLKGSFVAASVAMSKLRARVEAREGDPDAINRIFAKMWGLTEEQANMVPHLHLAGSESTRMAAMEDRAYHSLSGHPAYTGGFRIDMASLAPDALGEDVPLNWPRIRTGLKAIANMQVNADLEMMALLGETTQPITITMDLTRDSQKKYVRGTQWETALDAALGEDDDTQIMMKLLADSRSIPGAITRSLLEEQRYSLFRDPDKRILASMTKIANIVKSQAQATLQNIITIILDYSGERRLLAEGGEAEYDELDVSTLSKSFDVPRYKLTRTSMKRGLTPADRNPDKLPDMQSRGPKAAKLDMQELRSSGMIVPIDIPSVLNLAVYLTINRTNLAVAAYKLVSLVRDPSPGAPGKVALRLRNRDLYHEKAVKTLGDQLFGEDFLSIFETLCSNMAHSARERNGGIKAQIWEYMCRRTTGFHACPVLGDWRDLLTYLREADEGWTLYYWARVSMGKLHYAVGNDILAPIAAGEEVDFLTLMRRSVQARAKHWSAYYTAQGQLLAGDLEEHRKKVKQKRRENASHVVDEIPDTSEHIKRYVPPHLRKYAQLELAYDDDDILGRKRGYTREQYKRMVEMQAKAKFFKNMVVASKSRQLSVGISDQAMRDTVIEFYQARWYSLHKRLERARETQTPFYLGRWLVTEHPWGELITTFPPSLQGMLEFCEGLDNRAWTVPMRDLWTKFHKSLAELWQDVSTELQKIQDYIGDVYDCLADVQVEIDAKRRVESVIRSMSDVAAIPIPVSGYRPMYRLPERFIEVQAQTGRDTVMVEASPLQHVDKDSQVVLESEYGDLLSDPVDDEDDPGGEPLLPDRHARVQEIHVQISRYLTYNEIWSELGFPDVEAAVKRAVFGVPSTTDVDGQHLDAKYGPTILYEESHRVQRLWARLKSGMQKRLGQSAYSVANDDM